MDGWSWGGALDGEPSKVPCSIQRIHNATGPRLRRARFGGLSVDRAHGSPGLNLQKIPK
jgi:hypothetical protein